MAYATVAQLREYLKSLPTQQGTPNASPGNITATDAVLTSILDRATSMVEQHNGFSFAAYPSASAKSVLTYRSQFLYLPPHEAGSVTTVVDNGTTVASTEYDVLLSSDGRREYLALKGSVYSLAVWSGRRATITAKWGYGPAPAAIVEACLELAVNIWRGASKGMFSDLIGVDPVGNSIGGGGVAYSGFMTRAIREVLASVKTSYTAVTF